MPLRQLPMNVNHGNLDHVGRTPLNGSIDRISLGRAAQGIVQGSDIADVTAAARNGFDVTVLAGTRDGIVHVSANSWKLLKILFDNDGPFLARNPQPLRQAERGNAI